MNARLAALALLATFLLAAGPLPAAGPPCDPSPAAAALLDQVGDVYDLLELSPEEWTQTLARVDAALAEHPADLFLHRLRQDLFRYASKDVKEQRMPALREEYARLAEEHPGDPLFLYLVGRIAADAEREEAANVAAIEADPDFPWGHIGMVTVELTREEPALEAAERQLLRFADLCPSRVGEVLRFSNTVGSDEVWKERLPDLRRRLEEAPAEHADSYPALWALEFRVVDFSQHDAVRARVARDVEKLAALEPRSRKVLEALEEGYELSGRQDAAEEVEKELLAVAPCSTRSVLATLNAWEEEHPKPEPDASEEATTAWETLRGEAARGWIERCPDEYRFWTARLAALRVRDDVDPEEVVRVGERTAELYGRWQGYSSPTGYELVAETFVEKKLGLGRAMELLDRAEEEAIGRRERRDMSRYPEDIRERIVESDLRGDWSRDLLRLRAQIARGELEQARTLLGELDRRLEEMAPGEDANGRLLLGQRGYESALWVARADLAEVDGRLQDALAYLLRAETVRPAGAPTWVQGLRSSEADDRIPALWARLGGGEDALAALRESRAAGEEASVVTDFSPWEDADGSLPEFELKDLSGRVWTRADLAGKTVFVNAWATWCGPCRAELPSVEALHERLHERDDVLVVTLNMDDNTGAIVPYLTKEEFDFPVLLSRDFLREDLEVFSIPKSWIVDGTGALRREQLGFDPSLAEDEWIAQVEQEMEAVAATGGPGERR